MRKNQAIPALSSEDLMKPDTFWKVVEKLLLHSSHDEQKRLRHNFSVSAFCRGHALSPTPRDKTLQITKSRISLKDIKKLNEPTIGTKSTKESSPSRPLAQSRMKDKSYNTNANQSKSECKVSESEIVFVKDSEIPASERLWRFAVRKRQQQQDSESREKHVKPIPSVKNNEAIFEGLKKRLGEAKEDIVTVVKSKSKQKRKTKASNYVKKHRCENTKCKSINLCFVSNKTDNENSKCALNTEVALEKVKRLSSPKQKLKSKSFAQDLRCTPGNSLVDYSATNISSAAPEHFEAKKSMYDTILKKRLSCGNRLDMLNKEIASKKMNPRVVLSRETTKKYTELKSNYLTLCYQESELRHQIAMLQTELYTMQTENIRKRAAAVKTITLGSKTAYRPKVVDTYHIDSQINTNDKVLLFPRLKPPKPLLLAQQKPENFINDQLMHLRKSAPVKELNTSSQSKASSEQNSSTSLPRLSQNMSRKGVCSFHSLTTTLEPPPKRLPKALLVPLLDQEDSIHTSHRLPKMGLPVSIKTQPE